MNMKKSIRINKPKILDIYIKNEKMKNLSEKYIDSLVSKIIKETLEGKANGIATKLNELGGMDDGHPKFGKMNLSKMSDEEIEALMSDDLEFEDDEDYFGDDYETSELEEGSEVCEECGGYKGGDMVEGKLCECGGGRMYEEEDAEFHPAGGPFDYVEEEVDFEDETESEEENLEFCKYQKNKIEREELSDDEREDLIARYDEKCSAMKDLAKRPISMNERLKGNQKKIDRNHNGKIDSEDFKMLRNKKQGVELDEKLHGGQKKLDKNHNGRIDSEDFKMLRKKSVKLSESEMIDLIERIVMEEKESEKQTKNIKTSTSKGLDKYNQVHQKDGKENKEALEATAKKMKEYLKDGSKGDYVTEPKIFPKGNGELAKMEKKAYKASKAVEDYVDNLTAAGQENLMYDEIHPNEDWMKDNIEGSSRTGNNPEWANTGESDVNKKRNEIRKKNLLGKIKQKAYNKSPQPIVTDSAGEDEGDKLMAKLESVEPKTLKKINEEFDRMKSLIGYNQKTQ